MQIFIITGLLVWNIVLVFFIIRDRQLLLKVLRWSTTIWLFFFGILVSEVLREGLIVNGDTALHWDIQIAWTLWFILVASSIIDWRFLVPAVALVLWFLSYPEVRTLLDYGLVRLKWVGIVHNPLTWAASRPSLLEFWIRWKRVFETVMDRAVLPVLGLLKGLMHYIAGWIWWTTDRDMEKLRPSANWSWLKFIGRW
ncbi:hypothetical protein GGS21DRAFT_519893 [Xylaria nigripes]|nr:hypothetical protein GGS21DRAFT_519893 [Xylaria nigripes]